MNTHEQFITLETAKLAKQAGFDWKVYACYYKSSPDRVSTNGPLTCNFNGYAFQQIATSAPTQSVLQRWLREVKGWEVFVNVRYGSNIEYICRVEIAKEGYNTDFFPTYEAALEAGLQKCLTLFN